MIGITTLTRRALNVFLALFIITAQLLAPLSSIVPTANASHPIPDYECVNDTAGANDEPGQKDLTHLCLDDTHLPQEVQVTWNWDETGTNGANTLDACSLFDTDSDGYVNYSVCVVTKNDPATLFSTALYSCGDDKPDRCTSPVTPITIIGTTACTIQSPSATDPFPAGDDNPSDTKALCTLDLDDVGGVANAELIDVCSYPSQQPNSDPSDCVIIKDTTAYITLVKQIVPETDDGLFNLLINGQSYANNVRDNGTTGIVNVDASGGQGTVFTVNETAGTNTSLSGYSSNVQCTVEDKLGNPTVGPLVNNTATTVTLKPMEEAVCKFTNTRSASITIIKDAVPNDTQDFDFTATGTGVSNFSLDDDSDNTLTNSKTFSNLSAGTYTFTEAATAGWYLDDINCPNISETQNINDRSVSLTIAAGQNITCTFENRKLGQVIVTKQTNPNGDPQEFSITASGTNTISGNATRDIVDDETETFIVRHGEYDVVEQDLVGWIEDYSACQNLVINGSTPLVNGIPTRSCTITNTKLATLNIIKDALPNDAQDFSFTTTGLGGAVFSLDDDSDNTLLNQQSFTNLTPGQQYSVTEQSTPGWSLTGLTCNNVAQNGSTASVTPTAGQTITCTFTNTKLRSISGTKYTSDANGGLGPVLGGWTIFIDGNDNDILDQGELSDVTDSNGSYSFENLLPGSYILKEVLLSGWTQIFSPRTVSLTYNDDSTGNDFGNFQNGSVSGYKWNDLNGNGGSSAEAGEPKLAGWTIKLFRSSDNTNGNYTEVASTVTDADGNYSFTDLSPLPSRFYSVCEVQQSGWTQTAPTVNACRYFEINISGESNTGLNFGNQGRGSITVNKNVDTDGDGDIDTTGATNWTWDLGGTNYATGSTQNVAAGDYSIHEDQQTDYHFNSVACTRNGQYFTITQSETVPITVNPGDAIVCTFVNTRDTATIEVVKNTNPTNDAGKFNLNINGVAYAVDVSHGGTTGAIQVPTGTYTVSETAGTGTNLSDYSSSHECIWNSLRGGGDNTTSVSGLVVEKDDSLVCTFTNTRYGKIIVEKQTNPDGSNESFEFASSYDFAKFNLVDGESNDSGNLMPGTYSVSEITKTGWDLASTTCDDGSDPASIELAAGETVTCTFTNVKRAKVTVTKFNDRNENGTQDAGEEALSGWEITLDTTKQKTSQDGTTTFTNILPGEEYIISETQQKGWEFSSISCTGIETAVISRENPNAKVYPVAGETVICKIGNYKPEPAVLGEQIETTEQLVDTGSSSSVTNMYIGLGLLSTGVATVTIRRKKDEIA